MTTLLTRTSNTVRVTAAAAILALTAPAPAQSGGGFDLSWSTIESGGGLSEGGAFKLAGVAGQAEATSTPPSGGTYSLTPGFLQDASYFPVPVTLTAFSFE